MGQRQVRAQVVQAPSRPGTTANKSVFLAGTLGKLAGRDWRESLSNDISHLPVTILNPQRRDWDSSWREDVAFRPFREQVEWEMDMQELADVIAVYFGPETDAPVSLLEFGLCARSGKAVVACHKDYRKRGYVQMVCERFGIEFVDAAEDLAASVTRRLEDMLGHTGESA